MKPVSKMKIITPAGIAEPMPLSDLQMNNRILLTLTMAVWMIIVIAIWVIWKVISTGAVNNYIASCV